MKWDQSDVNPKKKNNAESKKNKIAKSTSKLDAALTNETALNQNDSNQNITQVDT